MGQCQRQEETVVLMELQMCRQAKRKGAAGQEVKNICRSQFMKGFLGDVKLVFKFC